MDTTRVGTIAAELMENISEKYGEDATLGVVAVVVELDVPASDENEHGETHIVYRCSEPRRWIQAGLFERAKRVVN